MTIRVLVNGAAGRMGQISLKALQDDDELVLVGEADQEDNLLSVIHNVTLMLSWILQPHQLCSTTQLL